MRMDNVLWIGGGCGAGKTTLASRLAHRFDLRLYRVDVLGYPHLERMTPERHPVNCRLSSLDYKARHVDRSPEQLADDFIACSAERFELILADLAELRAGPMVLAEGPGLLPDLVDEVVASPAHAIWLLPTTEFTDANLRRRDSARPVAGADAERAHRQRVARDDVLTAAIATRATEHGLPSFDVDGSLDLAGTGERLAAHFAPAIAAGRPARDAAQRSAIRRAENRETNTAVAAHREYLGDKAPDREPVLSYACECGASGCTAVAELTPGQYMSPLNVH